MKQQQRKVLALAAVLALASLQVEAQTAARRGGGAVAIPQAAFSAADAGYQAYARRDFAAAVANAQRAVQLAPNRRDWWLLLAQSLLATGQVNEAEQALERAAQASGDDAALARMRGDLARTRAQAAGEAMYRALAANDVKGAVEAGLQATQFAPENPGYRLVLVHALLRDGRFGDAERVASETIALLPDSAAPLAMRGYARQGLGRTAEAAADLDRALQQRGVSAASQRQLRLLAADLALAQNDNQRALELLQPLPGTDTEAAGRRELARQRQAARAPTPYALRAPGIDCSNVDAAQTCTLQAAAVPPLPGFANASAGYQAMEQKDYARALEQARLATEANPVHRDWQLLYLNAALNANQLPEAERAATAAIELASAPDAALLAQRAGIRRRLGNAEGANADAEAALRAGGLPVATEAQLLADLGRLPEARARLASAPEGQLTQQGRLDLAYLSARMGDSPAALAAFQQADAAGGLPPTSLLDAGYAAMHSKQDEAAVGFFHRAIDAVNNVQLKVEPQMLYDTRRTVADLTRRWGVLASVTLRNGGGLEPGFGAVGGGGGRRVVQAGAEGYWRPWGWRNGQLVEFFVRGFGTLHDQAGGFTGTDSFQGGVGVRWKPLTNQNLVLSLSRIFGPNVNDDWLAQVGYSWDRGNDLRVDVPSWWTTRLFAEVGRYLGNGVTYGIANATFGRSYLLGGSGRTVLFPHAFIGMEYTSNDPSAKLSAGAGPGVSVRHWFREDVYTAPRSYWDFTVQYRARLAGDDRMRGLYVNTLLNY